MPYKSIRDLPPSIAEHLPEHAQEIFLKAFNSAWDQYNDQEQSREETAFRIAWSVVKKMYEKDERSGMWVKRGESDLSQSHP